MLSTKRVKELLKDRNLSDEEAEKIRDGFRELAEIVFEKWQADKKTNPESGPGLNNHRNVRYGKKRRINSHNNKHL